MCPALYPAPWGVILPAVWGRPGGLPLGVEHGPLVPSDSQMIHSESVNEQMRGEEHDGLQNHRTLLLLVPSLPLVR